MSDVNTALANVNAFAVEEPLQVAWQLDRDMTVARSCESSASAEACYHRQLVACASTLWKRPWMHG